MKLDFIVAGFSKCGTTTLCAHLADHPEIGFSDPKEPNFFSRDNYADYWDEYRSYFTPNKQILAYGEGSPAYSTFELEERTKNQILQHYPNMKFIFIARKPIKRIQSAFREFHNSGPKYGLDTPFDPQAAFTALPAILADTCYWDRLNNYRLSVPDERIYILFLEDLMSNTKAELAKCFRFIGVDHSVEPANSNRRLNAGGEKYYDSRLLRAMRNHPLTGIRLSKIDIDQQDKFFTKTGLRKRFSKSEEWDAETKAIITARVGESARRFLEHCGKSPDYWG